jgi:hypothetical protein
MFVSKKMFAGLSVACLLTAQAAVPAIASASTLRAPAGMAAFFGSHTVKMSVHNATGGPLQIAVGDKSMTVEAGKTVEVSGMDGTPITVTVATRNHAAGEVLSHLSKDFAGATISVS